MTAVRVRYFDGQTALAHDVTVAVDGDHLSLQSDDGLIADRIAVSELVPIDDGIGDLPVALATRMTPGRRIAFPTAAAARTLIAALPEINSRPKMIGTSTAMLVKVSAAAAVVAGLIYAALPIASHGIATLIPQKIERDLGDDVVKSLTSMWPRCENPYGVAALDQLVAPLIDAADTDLELKFHVVKSPMVNALALPGGHIVIFYPLIERASDPDEISGIVAHEIGHQLRGHPLEGFVQNIGVRTVIAAILGGSTPTAVTDMSSNLYSMRLSREAEQQADEIANRILRASGIGSVGLRTFFERLAEVEPDLSPTLVGYLSSHPPTPERIKYFWNESSRPIRRALSDSDWYSLRTICEKPDQNQESGEKGD